MRLGIGDAPRHILDVHALHAQKILHAVEVLFHLLHELRFCCVVKVVALARLQGHFPFGIAPEHLGRAADDLEEIVQEVVDGLQHGNAVDVVIEQIERHVDDT